MASNLLAMVSNLEAMSNITMMYYGSAPILRSKNFASLMLTWSSVSPCIVGEREEHGRTLNLGVMCARCARLSWQVMA